MNEFEFLAAVGLWVCGFAMLDCLVLTGIWFSSFLPRSDGDTCRHYDSVSLEMSAAFCLGLKETLAAIMIQPFRDITSQTCHSPKGKESSQFDILPLESAKIRKNQILCMKISFLALNYIPLCISPVFKENKKIHIFHFSKNNCSNLSPPPP